MAGLGPTLPWTDDRNTTDRTGDTIGRFVVLGPLGQGGMGVVLAAYDPVLDRKVALKLLHDPGSDERLLREARAMAKLSHPNVLAVHEVGTVDGRAFIAMKYAEGGTLRAWCAAPGRTWTQIRDAYLQAGRGLAAAHAAGLVHRDFKPENALVTDDDVVCVSDFGLVGEPSNVTDASPAGDAGARITRSGVVMGTPAYMAPEQHAARPAGPAADQFAYCVALWEALYGTRPVTGETPAELAAAADRAGDAVPPIETAVPPWIAAALRRGCQRDPAARWPSLDALVAALARDPTAARRRRALVAGAVVVGALAIGGTTYAIARHSASELGCDASDRFAGVWDASTRADLASRAQALQSPFASRAFDRVAQHLDERTRAWNVARRDACEATRVRKEQSDTALDLRTACLERRYDELAGFIDLLRAPTAAILDRAASKGIAAGDVTACADASVLARRQPLPPEPRRTQIVALDHTLAADRASVDVDRRIDPATLAAHVAQARALAYPPVTATALYNAGLDAKNRSAYADARSLLEQALPLADAGGDDELRFQIAEKLAQVVGANLDQFADGLRYGELASGILQRLPAAPLRDADLKSVLADVYWRKGELPRATELAKQAVEIGERVDPNSLRTADYVYVLAMLHADSDDPHGAIELVNVAAKRIAAALGTDYPVYAACLNVRGAAERRSNQLAAAEADFQHAIAIYRAARGDDAMELGIVYTNMGSMFDNRRDYEAAIAQQRLAIAVFTHALGADATRTLSAEQRLGDSLSKAKHYDEAGALLAQTTAALERTLGHNHPYVANGYQFLGNHDRRIKAFRDALAQFHTAEAIWIAIQGKDAKNLTRVYQSLGDTYADLGDLPAAITSYEAALAHIHDDATGGATRGDLDLALADVLVKSDPGQAHHAHELALAARAAFVALGAGRKDDVAEVDAWLAKHTVGAR